MARHKRHSKNKHRASHPGRAPDVIPVTARFKRKFEHGEQQRSYARRGYGN